MQQQKKKWKKWHIKYSTPANPCHSIYPHWMIWRKLILQNNLWHNLRNHDVWPQKIIADGYTIRRLKIYFEIKTKLQHNLKIIFFRFVLMTVKVWSHHNHALIQGIILNANYAIILSSLLSSIYRVFSIKSNLSLLVTLWDKWVLLMRPLLLLSNY